MDLKNSYKNGKKNNKHYVTKQWIFFNKHLKPHVNVIITGRNSVPPWFQFFFTIVQLRRSI